MAEGIDFGISLSDRMSGPAKDASRSLSELAKSLSETKKELSSYQQQLSLAKNLGDIEGYRKYTSLVGEHRKKLYELRSSMEGMKAPAEEHLSIFQRMREGFVRTVEPAEVLKGAFEGVAAGFHTFASALKAGEAKEAVAGLSESLAGLAQILDLVEPGLGQVAAAVVRLGGAFAGMTVGLVQSGIELSVEATQTKSALIDTFAALGDGTETGERTEEMLANLSHQIGITRKELAPMAASFMAMGIRGEEELRKVTLAAASAKAMLNGVGRDGSAAFEGMMTKVQQAIETHNGLKLAARGLGKQFAAMGVNIAEVAAHMRNMDAHGLGAQLKAGTVDAKEFGEALQNTLIEKGAKTLERMAMKFSSMKAMFGQSMEELFEGLDKYVDPLIAQVKELLGLFDKGSALGKTMGLFIGGAMRRILEAATQALPYVEIGLLKIATYSLKAHTWMKKHWHEIKEAIKPVGIVLKAVGIVIVGVLAAATASFAITTAAVGAFGVAILWVIGKISQLASKGYALVADFVKGLLDGFEFSMPYVKKAASKLAGAALEAARAVWLTQSPSKVMFKMGGFFAEGAALGIRGGQPKVAQASHRMGASAVTSASTGMRASDFGSHGNSSKKGKNAGSGHSIQGGVHIHMTAPNGVTNAVELTEVAVATIFERLMLSQGA